MDGAFSSLQRSVQHHSAAHDRMLTGYAHAVDGLLMGLDRAVLERQRAELQEQLEAVQQLVRSFLLEELQQDVPTGVTPCL
ncbi:kinesin-like protein KIF11-B [Xiphophorus hellerii]|uniref:kinesin-like protein KIF11-B n=1 Tax=Xiphophorus hellerii TaxID=8084 RepID=UPI0013B3E5AB|nr:kinesin-like protein KIF11-B [Xiphophorus hellerii]